MKTAPSRIGNTRIADTDYTDYTDWVRHAKGKGRHTEG